MVFFDILLGKKLGGSGGGGGGGSESLPRKDVNFIDYDGTIVNSYTAEEFLALTAMPSNPSHDGLVSQGWNWTLEDAKAQVHDMGACNVGQMYITKSGDTEIDVWFSDKTRLSPILTIAVNGTITIDWGDNTTPDTVTGSSISARVAPSHVYASTGRYTIKITVVNGLIALLGGYSTGSSSSYPLLLKNTNLNENRVYANCVQAVRLGSGITSIGNYSFLDCYSLTSVTIPAEVTNIGDYAFYNCYSLASITIPTGAINMGNNMFNSCRSLVSIAFPAGVTNIVNNIFSYCIRLSLVTIPAGVTDIGSYAFSGCFSLTSITIPAGVTNIGANAFSECYTLSSITIPSGVTNIAIRAFNNCYGMAEYHLLPTTPPTLGGTTTFGNITYDCMIYVPAESLADYKAAQFWSSYANKIVGE